MLSIVIPVYNEAAVLGATLEAVVQRCGGIAPQGFEIVLADDGSTDGSTALAESLADALAGQQPALRALRVVRLPVNRGKGNAVRAGVLAARGDPVVYFDADLSTPLDELPRFLAALAGGADVAIGTRKHQDARIERPQPWLRVALGRSYTRLANALLGLQVSDFTCGCKAFRAAAARAIFTRQRLERWSFDAEIVCLAHRMRMRVDELPVRWINRPDSRVRVAGAVVRSFLELLAIRWHALRGHYD